MTIPGGSGIDGYRQQVQAMQRGLGSIADEHARAQMADVLSRISDALGMSESDFAGMTPSALLVLARRCVDGSDDQINALMQTINRRSALASEISKEIEGLNAISALAPRNGGDDDNMVRVTLPGSGATEAQGAEVAAVEALCTQYGINIEDLREVASGGRVSTDQIQSLIEGKRQELSRVNSGNEMDMVTLQSVMQQRSADISLVTQMLRALSDANEKVIGNIG